MIKYEKINSYESVFLSQETDCHLSWLLKNGYKIVGTQVQADKNITEIAFTLFRSEELPVYEEDETGICEF